MRCSERRLVSKLKGFTALEGVNRSQLPPSQKGMLPNTYIFFLKLHFACYFILNKNSLKNFIVSCTTAPFPTYFFLISQDLISLLSSSTLYLSSIRAVTPLKSVGTPSTSRASNKMVTGIV